MTGLPSRRFVLGVGTVQLSGACRGGGVVKQIEDAEKTCGGKALGREPFDGSARQHSGRQRSLAPRVPQDTE
ncbi:MAG TPA: hypothetical protein VFF32_07180 [Dermatophilaceae bacterium]|nr:hypothetical protein [Dermatophilaceae bacterium]